MALRYRLDGIVNPISIKVPAGAPLEVFPAGYKLQSFARVTVDNASVATIFDPAVLGTSPNPIGLWMRNVSTGGQIIEIVAAAAAYGTGFPMYPTDVVVIDPLGVDPNSVIRGRASAAGGSMAVWALYVTGA